jgi:hypothetical protein
MVFSIKQTAAADFDCHMNVFINFSFKESWLEKNQYYTIRLQSKCRYGSRAHSTHQFNKNNKNLLVQENNASEDGSTADLKCCTFKHVLDH